MPTNFKQIVIGFLSVILLIVIGVVAQQKIPFFKINEQKFEEKQKLSDEENKELKMEKISDEYKYIYNPVGGFRLTFPTEYNVQGRSKKFEALASSTFAGDISEYSKLQFEIRYLDNGETLFDKVQKDFVNSEVAMGKNIVLYELIRDSKYGQSSGFSYLCSKETRAECAYIKIDDIRYLYIIKEFKAEKPLQYEVDHKTILDSFAFYR